MIQHFIVAGHGFALEMGDDNPLWLSMDNYAPFKADIATDCVFSLKVKEGKRSFDCDLIYSQKESPDYLRMDLYRTGQNLLLEVAPKLSMPPCCQLLFCRDYKKAELYVWDSAELQSFSLNNAIMVLYAFSTASLNTLEMHASTVVKDGKGYLFLGKSGTGKSTHSNLWLKAVPGTELLNDDNPVVRVMEDGSVLVYGTPWSGKTPCYRNISVPVGAIVRIQRAPNNAIARLNLPMAYASLSSSISAFRPDRSIADGVHKTLASLAATVPCFCLECLPDEDAAKLCYENVKH